MTALEGAQKMIAAKGYLVIGVPSRSLRNFKVGDRTTNWAENILPQEVVIIAPATIADWHEQESILGMKCSQMPRDIDAYWKAVTD